MDAMTFTAGQLQAREPAGIVAQHAVRGRSHAEDIRALLEELGPQPARALGEQLDLPPGRISALMKWDLKVGRVCFHDGVYELAPDWQPTRGPKLQADQEVIQWHEVTDQLPDADLTVLVRTRDCDEPVWLGHLDGEVWRDTLGDEITVVRWAEMPLGGEE